MDQTVESEVFFFFESNGGEDDVVERRTEPPVETAQNDVVQVDDSRDHLFVLVRQHWFDVEVVGRVSVSNGWRRRCQSSVRNAVGQVVSKSNACCG